MNRLAALLSFLFPVLAASAQVTITVDDLAAEGDVIYFSSATPVGEFDLTEDGPDQLWDYTFLDQMGQDSSVWVDPTDTNPAYFFLWFGSNVAEETGQTFSSDFFSLEDIYNFYDRTEGGLSITGIAGTVSGIPLPASFDEPDLLYDLPLNYDDAYSSSSGFTFAIPGIGSWTESRERTCHVDGFGEVTTPYGSFDALRVNCELFIDDVFEYSGIEFPISYTMREYRWMSPDMLIPVLFISTQDILGSETVTSVQYIDTLDAVPVGVHDLQSEKDFRITPNIIGQGMCHLELPNTGAATIGIFDLSGRPVTDIRTVSGTPEITLDVSHLVPGWYWCRYWQTGQVISLPFLIMP